GDARQRGDEDDRLPPAGHELCGRGAHLEPAVRPVERPDQRTARGAVLRPGQLPHRFPPRHALDHRDVDLAQPRLLHDHPAGRDPVLSTEMLAAAQMDGAGAMQRFFHITVPQLSNTLLFVVVTWFLGGLQMFTQSYVMTDG